MKMFIFNMDRKNSDLVRSLDDLLVKKQALPGFGSIKATVVAKNNGYLLTEVTEDDIKVIWSAVKMISQGTNSSYWITDYGTDFKFVTLRRKAEGHEFKKFPVKSKPEKKEVLEVTPEVATDLQSALTSGPKLQKKEFKKLERIKLEDLTPSEDFTLDVKFNPDKPFSLAQVGREKKLVKIPADSWLVIRGNKFRTENEEIKNILSAKEFEYDEGLPTVE